MNGGSAIISGNTISNSVRPIEFWGVNDVTITDNILDSTTYDFINIDSFTGILSPIQGNAFLNMGVAKLHNRTASSVDATENYWGDMDPSDNVQNSGGGDIIFCPWLDAVDGNPVGDCLGEIQGRKYEDKNKNGYMDAGSEYPGIKDWKINLYDSNWSFLKSMKTGDDSAVSWVNVDDDQFRFENLQAGTYYVCEEHQLGAYQNGPSLGDKPKNSSGGVAHTNATAVGNGSPNSSNEEGICWEVTVDASGDTVGTIKFGNVKVSDPSTPDQIGYNENNGDPFSSPRPPELLCTGAYTNINGISVHWEDVSTEDPTLDGYLKYQRQYNKNGGNWSGNEIYTDPYTNYRSFGGGSGNDGNYGSRVRAFYDLNDSGFYEVGEPVSEWSKTCSITYDKTAPEPPVLTGDPVQYVNWGNVTRSWLPSSSTDIDYYMYKNITNGWPSGPYDAGENNYSITHSTGNYDRVFEWKVLAVDNVGNETWSEDTYRVVVDGTDPTVDITDVDITDKKLSFKVSGTDNLSGARTVGTNIYNKENTGPAVIEIGRLAHDIAPETLSVSYDAIDIDISKLPSEVYTIRAAIRDYSGNLEYATYQIEVDNTPPDSTITSPNPDSYHGESIKIEGNTIDDFGVAFSGVDFVKLYSNNGDGIWHEIDQLNNSGDEPYYWDYEWTPTAEGTYSIKAAGTDMAGNVENSAVVANVVYDTTAPKVSLGSNQLTNKGINKVASASDDLSGIESYQWFKKSGPGNVTFGTPNEKQTTIAADKDGVYEICLTVKDKAGNEATGCMSLTLDTIAPKVLDWSVEIEDGDKKTDDRDVTLKLFATEAHEMIIGNDSSFAGSSWEAYATTKAWELSAGEGPKFVYAKFRDKAGNESLIVYDSIKYDKGDDDDDDDDDDDTADDTGGVFIPYSGTVAGTGTGTGATGGETTTGETDVTETEGETPESTEEDLGFVESGEGNGEGEGGIEENKKPSMASLVASALWPDSLWGKIIFFLLFLVALGILWFLLGKKKKKEEEEEKYKK